MRIQTLCMLIGVFLSATFVHQVGAQDRYYMMVFAWQGPANRVYASHTFATFVKASGDGKDHSKYRIDVQTISWMPKSMVINALRLQPVRGGNLGLAESLKFAESINSTVTMWGPFATEKKIYDMAVNRIEYLNSGRIDYVIMDRRFRPMVATNCIHAVSDLDVEQSPLSTGSARGDAASESVLRHLQKWEVASNQDASWLVDRLQIPRNQVRLATMAKAAKR